MPATLQLLVFHLDGRQHGIRLAQLERVIRSVDVTPVPQAPGIVLGMIDVQGEIVPVLSIRRRFNLPERKQRLNDQFIIAHTSRRRVALVVDDVGDITERSTDDFVEAEKIVPHLEQIEGVVQLKGDLILIHDLDRFLSLEDERALEQALTSR